MLVVQIIRIFYITGIYFTNRDKNAFISWSKKNISFKTLEKITNENNIPLVFLDMEKKNLLIKNGNDNNSFDISTITNDFSAIRDEELFDYVKINKINEELENIFKGIKEQTKIQELKFNQKAEIVENIDEEGIKIYEKEIKREINKEKKINIKVQNPIFLSNINPDILTTFKIGKRKLFSYYNNKNEEMEIKEIKKGKTKNIKIKDIQIYYLKKKTERNNK